MKKIFPLIITFIASLILFTSCKKDEVAIPIVTKPYLKSVVQNTRYGRDSMVFLYNGNTISGMSYYFDNTLGGYYTYAYNSDSSLFKLTWTSNSGVEQYQYQMLKQDGKLKMVTNLENVGVAWLITKAWRFAYIGDKLDKVYATEDYNEIFELDTAGYYKVTYTGNDITQIVGKDLSGGLGSVKEGYKMDYTYDNKPNGFAAVNKNYWAYGYNYKNTETFSIYDVIATLSLNTLTSETINGGTPKNYTYTKDAKGNIIASSGGGSFYLNYR
jgi:hypothetical protein